MIQPNFPYVQGSSYSGSQHPSAPNSHSAPSGEPSDEAAFRMWLARRESARQQMRRLSRREHQVVNLVANGLANKSIALELEISVKTIEKHRANAGRKLGVNSTAELVRLSVLADQDFVAGRERQSFDRVASDRSSLERAMPERTSTERSASELSNMERTHSDRSMSDHPAVTLRPQTEYGSLSRG